MKQPTNLLFKLFWIIVLCLLIGCNKKTKKADLVLEDGVFFTLNSVQPFAEGVAIRGSRILAIGSNEEIVRFVGPKTERINLQGKFGIPGFNDANFNLWEGGKTLFEVNLLGVHSGREIQKIILKKLRRLEPGSWLVGWGWDHMVMENEELPTRRILDVIAPDVPIFLKRICGHIVLVNRKALEIAGITLDTPDPPGGIIERDSNTGVSTGILIGDAINLVEQYIPNPSNDEMFLMVRRVLEKIKSFGITTVQDFSNSHIYSVYEQLLNQNKLTCRVSIGYPLHGDNSLYSRLRNKYNSSFLHFGSLRGTLDGTLCSRTALLFHPYSDDPLSNGIAQMKQNELNMLVLTADRDGFQVSIDAVGDHGIRMALDSYELTQKINGERERRHRIEHVQVLSQEDIPRFYQLNVIASMQPAHCIEDMQRAKSRIGQERCRSAHIWNTLQENGARLAFGTNWPMVSMNPLIGLYTAVTRRDTLGYPGRSWFPQERITIEEAIKAYTLGAAYAEFREEEKGSIEPGKLADIVILNKNLLEISPKMILNTKVVYTILNGKVIFNRNKINH